MKDQETNPEDREPSPTYGASKGMGIALNVICIVLGINLVAILIFISVKFWPLFSPIIQEIMENNP